MAGNGGRKTSDAPYAQWKKEEGESKRTRKLPGMLGRRRGEGQENQEYEIREAAQRRLTPGLAKERMKADKQSTNVLPVPASKSMQALLKDPAIVGEQRVMPSPKMAADLVCLSEPAQQKLTHSATQLYAQVRTRAAALL